MKILNSPNSAKASLGGQISNLPPRKTGRDLAQRAGNFSNLKVAIVADWLSSVGGSEKVVWHLHQMFPKAPIYTTIYDRQKAKEFQKADVRTSFLQKIPGAIRKHQLFIPLMPLAIGRFNLSGYDLVISSSHTVGHGIKIGPKTSHICYCHTPVRWAWETKIDSLKDRIPLGPIADILAAYFRWWSKKAAHNVTQFIGNSQYIVKRINRCYRRPAIAIYPPVTVDQIPLETKKSDFYLTAGRLIAYKRTEIIIEAFNQLGLPLKVLGSGPKRQELMKQAKNNIEFLGYMSNQSLYQYYGKAKGFIFASLEDFGIVPVEAMAAGTPVIGFGDGGLRETVVDKKTGLFFNYQTAASIIDGVRRAQKMRFSPQTCRRQAEKFSVANFQTNMIKVIEDTLRRQSPHRQNRGVSQTTK